MARVTLLLLILLVGLTVAFKPKMRPPGQVRDIDLPPKTRKRVMALRGELQALLTPECKRLLYVLREIMWARKCIFRGLPVSEYLRLKEICKNRSESLDALRAYRMRCNSDPYSCDEAEFSRLFNERQKAVAACEKIGWDGDGKDCPNLRELEDERQRIKGACKDNAEEVKNIRKKIRDVKSNFARPSVAPVARFDL